MANNASLNHTEAAGVDLTVNIAGIEWKAPVTTAAGTYMNGKEYAQLIPIERLGALTVKSISYEPWPGNPSPRFRELVNGMIGTIGIQNPGVEYWIEHEWSWLRQLDLPVIVSIAGHSIEEFQRVAERLAQLANDDVRPAALEMNLSCPNDLAGLAEFGKDPEVARAVVKAVKDVSPYPVFTKLTPDVRSIAEIGQAVEAGGADAITMINGPAGMAIDVETGLPLTGTRAAGLTGPMVKPIALRMVWDVYEAVEIPIIGVGGVSNATDALEFIQAGATAVGVGTANFKNPRAPLEIIDGIREFLAERNISSVKELIGRGHRAWAELQESNDVRGLR